MFNPNEEEGQTGDNGSTAYKGHRPFEKSPEEFEKLVKEICPLAYTEKFMPIVIYHWNF